MQLNLLPAIFLFIGSYFPLSLILFVQDISEGSWKLPICKSVKFWSACNLPDLQNPVLAIGFVVLSTLSLIFFLWTIGQLRGMSDMIVQEVETVPNDLINYVFPYVVSFMGLELGDTGKVFGFCLFLAWMFLISYRSGQILMNPLLLVAGWQLYDIHANIGGHVRHRKALSKDLVIQGQHLRSCLVQGIYVLSKPK